MPRNFKNKRRLAFARHTQHESEIHVNINSLLDILSVILVFLMKNYSNDVVQLKPSASLQVPFSHSQQIIKPATTITITRKEILLDGYPILKHNQKEIISKKVDPKNKIITPLLQKLKEIIEIRKSIQMQDEKSPLNTSLLLVVDRHISFSLVSQVMSTAQKAEIEIFDLVTIKNE